MTFLSTLKKVASTAGDVLSAKGDLLSRSTSALGRLPVSTNNFSLLCASAETLGIKWGASATSTLTTAGDLLYASGANTLARLAKGTDNQVLKMNGSNLNWETLSGGGATVTHQTIIPTSNFTDAGTSLVDITGVTFTADDNAGSSLAVSCLRVERGTTNAVFFRWVDDSTTIKIISCIPSQVANLASVLNLPAFIDNDGQTVKMQLQNSSSGTVTVSGSSGTADGSYVEVLEIV